MAGPVIDTSEWITVAEYAARRHLSERQARRIVSALPEECRTPPDIRPAKVLWCPAASGEPPRPGSDQWQECPAHPGESPAGMRPISPIGPISPISPIPSGDAQYQALAKALEILREQLAAKDATIRELTNLVDQAQWLHSNDQQERFKLRQIAPSP